MSGVNDGMVFFGINKCTINITMMANLEKGKQGFNEVTFLYSFSARRT